MSPIRLTNPTGNAGPRERVLGSTGHPSPEAIAVGIARQAVLNRILAHGCQDCTGRIGLTPDGGAILCPALVRGELSETDAALFAGCGVPGIFHEAVTGARTAVTDAEIAAARPQEGKGSPCLKR